MTELFDALYPLTWKNPVPFCLQRDLTYIIFQKPHETAAKICRGTAWTKVRKSGWTSWLDKQLVCQLTQL